MLKIDAALATPNAGEYVNTNVGVAFFKEGQWTRVMNSSYPTYPTMLVPTDDVEWWESSRQEYSVTDKLPEINVKVLTNKGPAMLTEKGWVLVLPSSYANYTEMWVPVDGVQSWVEWHN